MDLDIKKVDSIRQLYLELRSGILVFITGLMALPVNETEKLVICAQIGDFIFFQ